MQHRRRLRFLPMFKVIVARSYVRQLGAGSNPLNPAADSRPDDFSPRDHSGHGTAVASAAAGNLNTGLVPISGVAPKAYLGSYRLRISGDQRFHQR